MSNLDYGQIALESTKSEEDVYTDLDLLDNLILGCIYIPAVDDTDHVGLGALHGCDGSP